MSETWRTIPGWRDLYEVSDLGRIRSLDRVVKQSNGHERVSRGRVLSPGLRGDKHLHVSLHDGERKQMMRVHRAVMLAFVGPEPDGMEVRHLNDDPADNRLENLVYGTRSENMQDRVRNGVHHAVIRTHCPQGHPLDAPNLVASTLRRGHRNCLACNRAQAYIRYHQIPAERQKAVADRYYQSIKESA